MVNVGLKSFLLMLALAAGCTPRQSTAPVPEEAEARQELVFHVHEHTLKPMLATDSISRKHGLQDQVPPDDGLILCFPFRQRQSLWMPNCPHPLEAWVMSANGEVLEILPLPAEPPQGSYETDWQYQSRLPLHESNHESQFMWEFASGEARRRSISPGDMIDGPWIELRNRIR